MNWDDYGIDWDGPYPHVDIDDYNTVTVPQADVVLSTEQKADLDSQLSVINPASSMTEGLLVNQFTTAKMFVNTNVAT